MSAVELIEQVKALSAPEREELLLAVLALDEEPTPSGQEERRAEWPDVEARTRRVFGDRLLPNLVMLEREESAG
ncbi:MAG: hypothetical protein H7A46_04725 [Verrucomicrobiales bacterium]|nr:hypothetical protein [Verrucomicrobiales bacterium]